MQPCFSAAQSSDIRKLQTETPTDFADRLVLDYVYLAAAAFTFVPDKLGR
jgi:hypothetical protein